MAGAFNKVLTNCRGGEPPRTRQGTLAGEYLRVYRYAMIIFAPALVSTALEMTVLSTVPQGWRRGEGAPPYRNDITPAEGSLYSNGIPLGGRGRSPLPHKASPWGEAVAKRLMRGCFLHFVRLSPTPHPSLGSLTLTLVPPSPKGEGINGHFLMSFRPKRG